MLRGKQHKNVYKVSILSLPQNHLTCLNVHDVMLSHQRLGYANFFNKLVSKQILCVEKSVHVLIDEPNSLIENDAQDKEFEQDLARKDLVLMHEGKCSEEGSGPEPISKEEWQGDKQTGRTAAEPCLK